MQVSVYLDKKVVRRIDALARQERRSRSNVIEKFLTDLVERPRVLKVVSFPRTDPLFPIHQKAVDTGIVDLSDQHDHYLYGTPKRR